MRLPRGVGFAALRNCGNRRRVRSGTKVWARCAGGPTGGTTGRHGLTGCAPSHGPPCAASGNGAAGRAGIPCSPAAASGHGTASSAAFRRTAAPGHSAYCGAPT